jgi:hypothetical protein
VYHVSAESTQKVSATAVSRSSTGKKALGGLGGAFLSVGRGGEMLIRVG